MNYVENGCPNFNHDNQGGAGGNAGAFYFDGRTTDTSFRSIICGVTFRNNRANELGGAIFRTSNGPNNPMTIASSVFDGNTARMGGVSFIKESDTTVISSTFMNNRGGVLIDGSSAGNSYGGLWLNRTAGDIRNSTFYNNSPTGLNIEGDGVVINSTFVESDVRGVNRSQNSIYVNTDCSGTIGGSENINWPTGNNCAYGDNSDPNLGQLSDTTCGVPMFSHDAGEFFGAQCEEGE
jgi:predicted outer membrane repeat protein